MAWCSLNGLVVMNTMFEKEIHKCTWQHPDSKSETSDE